MKCSLVIIGAGPAGLSAAIAAAKCGVETTLIDEQDSPGGQIYRAVEKADQDRCRLLGPDYEKGLALVNAFRAISVEGYSISNNSNISGNSSDDNKNKKINYLSNTSVWSINEKKEIGILRDGKAEIIRAQHIIIASGAIERPVPFPGWTLPGVMNAGAGQILMKSSGLVPKEGVVIAGTGPLLLLLAWQYLRAGIPVNAVLEVAPKVNLLGAAPYIPNALLSPRYLLKGLKYMLSIRQQGVPIIYGVTDLKARGREQLESVTCKHWRKPLTFDTQSLLIHFGVIPNTQLTSAVGCDHYWNDAQQAWCPTLDRWGNTSVAGVASVGDGAAVHGANAAEFKGKIAAYYAADSLGKLDQGILEQTTKTEFQALKKDCYIRPFLESLHRLPQELLGQPDDDVVVCRCEEITAAEIRQAVAEGHTDPNQVKFFTRCGMGPCLGQQCSHSVAHILAHDLQQPVEEMKPYRPRPPLKPLTISQLSELQQ